MNRRIIILIVAILSTISSFSQNDINEYKYVFVPIKFDFLRDANQYRINTLTKVLLEKYNFQTILEGETLPDDYAMNNCLALQVDVLNESKVFKTKLYVQLKNCKGEEIYKSSIGESRAKKHKVAYNMALRAAFLSFETLNYNYKPSNKIILNSENERKTSELDEIRKLKKELKVLKSEKEKTLNNSIDVEADSKQIKTVKSKNALVAKTSVKGFHLINSISEVIYKIKKTNVETVFLVEGSEAIIYKKGNNWFIDSYSNNTLVSKLLHITF